MSSRSTEPSSTGPRTIMQRPFGAHTYRRLCYIGDRTGLELIRTLEDQVLNRDIPFIDEVEDGGSSRTRQTGGYPEPSVSGSPRGAHVLFRCRAVVLATGGCGRVYQVTSNSYDCTGDGLALAYRAGAELLDMEMLQFHPTGMMLPRGCAGFS